MATIDVTYVLSCAADEVERMARGIALEQTVEVPGEVARAAAVPPGIIGEVAEITPLAAQPDRFRVRMRYAGELAAGQLPQLLNLVYGNISIKNKIRVTDIALPPELLGRFAGPNYGIVGVRAALGVEGRPLLATAIKPRGASLEHLAGVARDFALGGGDIVKDDHNLVDADFATFAERVRRCHAAVQEANAQTKRGTLYLPLLMPRSEELERQVEFLLGEGIRGVLVCPFLVGIDVVRRLAAEYPLLIMGHPALAGTFFHDDEHGMDPAVLLGTVLRLAGVDATVFPNHGGRFAFTIEQCRGIRTAANATLGRLRPMWPVPAGGMTWDSIPQMTELYGHDAIFLIGGALLSHSDSVRDSTAAFVQRISEFSSPRYAAPTAAGPASTSACEMGTPPTVSQPRTHLRYDVRQRWDGRAPTAYKASAELPFSGVTRHELIGRSGESTKFDLRYFEIEPGGFTSHERHRHAHVIVAQRGQGVVLVGEERIELAPNDVAYVPPDAPHQVRNESGEAFGFYCIVDHVRDRPRPV